MNNIFKIMHNFDCHSKLKFDVTNLNRIRIIIQIFHSIKRAIHELILPFRLNFKVYSTHLK